ncbi:hypothetical protein CU669_09130 [Paramagnetospirillum kuznetsovii]|uniref:Uncharacterized protein n=1 Tax=Paramagnetospirillum kuznetsovii TaxID=2053833 RepID=A0A364NZF5_9PROT|nr:hypothetical protein [Paramagnetospirillum kuznetsovii]RAU22275.1 hypothetical protein CU669_09130 [Paramagnetospirillum kuznetsovii]
MTDPLKNMIALQQAMLDGWMASSTQMMQYWKHMFELQQNLINQASTLARSHVEIDDGPSFTGKYGKRRFDIDPERDV